MTIDLELLDSNISEERRAELIAIKQTHIDEAVVQSREMSDFVHAFVSQHDPSQILPTEILPDYVEDDHPFQEEEEAPNQNNKQFYNACAEFDGGKVDATEAMVSPKPGLVTMQCEDCGGSLGFRRPAADYYNSNLMQNRFMMSVQQEKELMLFVP